MGAQTEPHLTMSGGAAHLLPLGPGATHPPQLCPPLTLPPRPSPLTGSAPPMSSPHAASPDACGLSICVSTSACSSSVALLLSHQPLPSPTWSAVHLLPHGHPSVTSPGPNWGTWLFAHSVFLQGTSVVYDCVFLYDTFPSSPPPACLVHLEGLGG